MKSPVDLAVYKRSTVLVTGWRGFLGTALCARLEACGAKVVRFVDDLTFPVWENNYSQDFQCVFHLAAKIAGIDANRRLPFSFLAENTLMALNAVRFAAQRKLPLVAAGSVCAYPENAEVPFMEFQLFNGRPERTNFGYGLSKRLLLGAMECAAAEYGLPYAHLISANLYGPGDNYGDRAHVIPALIEKFSEATVSNLPSVEVWGSGKATRDFLHVHDAADAYLLAGAYLMNGGKQALCNIGSGTEVSIATLASMLAEIYGYAGEIAYNHTRPDGQLRRRQNIVSAKSLLGWQPKIPLRQGLEETVSAYEARLSGASA